MEDDGAASACGGRAMAMCVGVGGWGRVSPRMHLLLMMVDGDADGDGRVHSIGAGDAVAGPRLSPVAERVVRKHPKPTWTPLPDVLFCFK